MIEAKTAISARSVAAVNCESNTEKELALSYF